MCVSYDNRVFCNEGWKKYDGFKIFVYNDNILTTKNKLVTFYGHFRCTIWVVLLFAIVNEFVFLKMAHSGWINFLYTLFFNILTNLKSLKLAPGHNLWRRIELHPKMSRFPSKYHGISTIRHWVTVIFGAS